ncbi:hypothetical protein [Streptomyces sp. NPDC047928]|uniref:hypothetical protein n=1 Tax=unclassified Streptomyces TaxID=2593676 RepID=UPI0037206D0D
MAKPVRVAAAARAAAKRAEKARTTPGQDAALAPDPRSDRDPRRSDRDRDRNQDRDRARDRDRDRDRARDRKQDRDRARDLDRDRDSEAPETTGSSRRVRRAGPGTARASSAEGTGRGRARAVTAILALLVVAGLAATTFLGLRYHDARRTDEARTAAVAAARKAAPVILSYDYRHLDRDFAAARRHLTGGFLDEYGKTTKAVVAPTATKYQGVVKATVAKPPGADASAAVSVVSASPDKAVVLLFMNQVTNSTQVTAPRVDLNRVRMTVVRTENGWKISAVDAL